MRVAESPGSTDITTLFGGLPFVHDAFASRTLLTAVAARRLLSAGEQSPTSAAIRRELDPLYAAQRRLVPPAAVIDGQAPTAQESAAVAAALTTLGQTVPGWGPLLNLPWVIRKIRRPGVISASSMGYPQHLFFGDTAFVSDAELREQVLHECSHTWLYMIEELWPLGTVASRDLTLPSGTAQRSVSEVLGATHVVTNLLRLVTTTGDTSPQRIRSLQDYRAGCRQLLYEHQSRLTPHGQEVAWLLTTGPR